MHARVELMLAGPAANPAAVTRALVHPSDNTKPSRIRILVEPKNNHSGSGSKLEALSVVCLPRGAVGGGRWVWGGVGDSISTSWGGGAIGEGKE